MFLGICTFLLGCPFYWHIIVCNILLWSFDICDVSCKFSFISDFIQVFFLFFLMSLAKDLSIFFIFSKNQLLVLLIFPIFKNFLFRLFLLSFLLFLFYWLLVLFVLLFLVPLGVWLDVYLRFFSFPEVHLYFYKLSF